MLILMRWEKWQALLQYDSILLFLFSFSLLGNRIGGGGGGGCGSFFSPIFVLSNWMPLFHIVGDI